MSVLYWAFCRHTEMGRVGSDVANIFVLCLLFGLDALITYNILKGY